MPWRSIPCTTSTMPIFSALARTTGLGSEERITTSTPRSRSSTNMHTIAARGNHGLLAGLIGPNTIVRDHPVEIRDDQVNSFGHGSSSAAGRDHLQCRRLDQRFISRPIGKIVNIHRVAWIDDQGIHRSRPSSTPWIRIVSGSNRIDVPGLPVDGGRDCRGALYGSAIPSTFQKRRHWAPRAGDSPHLVGILSGRDHTAHAIRVRDARIASGRPDPRGQAGGSERSAAVGQPRRAGSPRAPAARRGHAGTQADPSCRPALILPAA